jgi:hypothetical protein
MIVGVWAAQSSNVRTTRTLNWIAIAVGAWLIIGSFILRYPVMGVGLWNDLIVGAMAVILGVWGVRKSSQATG